MAKYMFKAMDVQPTLRSGGRASRPVITRPSAGVTGFAMGLNVTQSGGGSMGPHTHKEQSETMYIIEGNVKFTVGDEEYVCGPNDVIHAPAGVPHGFENLGEAECKFVWIFCPPLPDYL